MYSLRINPWPHITLKDNSNRVVVAKKQILTIIPVSRSYSNLQGECLQGQLRAARMVSRFRSENS